MLVSIVGAMLQVVVMTRWLKAADLLGLKLGFTLGVQTSASSARVAGSASRAAAAHCGNDAAMATRPTASFLATDRATECTRVSLLRSRAGRRGARQSKGNPQKVAGRVISSAVLCIQRSNTIVTASSELRARCVAKGARHVCVA